jgi:GGDEF domain-containing protein
MTEAHGAMQDPSAPARPSTLLDPGIRRVMEAAGVAVAALDPEGHVLAATSPFADRWGRPIDELVGMHLVGFWPEGRRMELTATLVRLVEGATEIEQIDLPDRTAAGSPGTARVTFGRLADRWGRTSGMLCTINEHTPTDADDTEASDRPERRQHLAAVELVPPAPLVAVEREAGPEPLLAAALRRSARVGLPLALLRCEVTGMDEAVARLSGDGDRHLESCWDHLFERLRATDTVMRTADDTFLVIAQDLGDEQDAAGVAYRLLAAAVEPFSVEGAEVPLSMTIGVVVADADSSPARMIEVAAAALAEARSDGTGGFRLVDLRNGLAA